jgi:hypothetical protein
MDMAQEVKNMRKELDELKRNRFSGLSANDVENMKNSLFDRQAATLASGAVLNYEVITVRGKRRVIPTYDRFVPIV